MTWHETFHIFSPDWAVPLGAHHHSHPHFRCFQAPNWVYGLFDCAMSVRRCQRRRHCCSSSLFLSYIWRSLFACIQDVFYIVSCSSWVNLRDIVAKGCHSDRADCAVDICSYTSNVLSFWQNSLLKLYSMLMTFMWAIGSLHGYRITEIIISQIGFIVKLPYLQMYTIKVLHCSNINKYQFSRLKLNC